MSIIQSVASVEEMSYGWKRTHIPIGYLSEKSKEALGFIPSKWETFVEEHPGHVCHWAVIDTVSRSGFRRPKLIAFLKKTEWGFTLRYR